MESPNPCISVQIRVLFLFQLAILFGVSRIFAQTANNVLVVVNDSSSDSQTIARYYAEKRNIPAENICHLRTAETESISRDAFERDIVAPITDHLKSRGLQDQILYIVTTRGVPLMVDGDSIDSQLALLYRYMLYGSYPFQLKTENPYFTIDLNRDSFRPFLRRDYDIYLVTRLTGATAADAMLLVDRALTSSPQGGFYFDLASAQETAESEWIQQAGSELKKLGMNVTTDTSGKVLDNLSSVEGYLNQGAADPNLAGSIPGIGWSLGAISTIFDKVTARASGPAELYVARGVTGFGGYVSDPTTDGYFRPQILFPYYAAGYNLAEAFYASTRYIGWRQVVIGHPLACPYAKTAAPLRSKVAGLYKPAVDAETGLPEHFARRRVFYLTQWNSTGRDAVVLLLKAESAVSRGNRDGALALVDRSLQQDPNIPDSHLLKAQMLEAKQDTAGAVDEYKRVIDLGRIGRNTGVRTARLALDKLKKPEKKRLQTAAIEKPPAPEVAPVPSPEPAPAEVKPPSFVPVRVLSRTPIDYPPEAKKQGLQGEVVVSLLIDEMGQVMKAEVVSGPRVLGEAVIEIARRWRFAPALENGRAVESRFDLPVTFKINKPVSVSIRANPCPINSVSITFKFEA